MFSQDLRLSKNNEASLTENIQDTVPVIDSSRYNLSKNLIDCKVDRRSDSSKYNSKTKVVEMYGNATIKYCDMTIEADEIRYNTETGDAEAFAIIDSLGNVQKYALLTMGGQELQYKYVKYNFKTKKANVEQLVTRQGEGVVRGEKVKQTAPGEFFIKNTIYTTCNLEHPHYYFTFNRAKIKSKKFAAGKNLNLYIKDIPTPVYFPFGIFPLEQGKRAGFTRPGPGYERVRGFSLKNVGWYQPINDHMDALVTSDFYSSGSWNVNSAYRYYKRYKYNVNLSFNYTYLRGFNVSEALGVDLSNSFQLNFNFNQDPKVWPNANLNASVSLGQRNFKSLNVYNPTERLNNTYTSSISFNKRFPNSPFSLSSNLRYNQNTQSKLVSLSLPDLNISMSTIYPFRGLSKTGKSSPLDNLNLSYRSNFKNQIETADSLFFEDPLGSIADGRYGAKHSIPLSASFKIAKFFTLSPSINYNEVWSSQYRDYFFDEVAGEVDDSIVNELNTARWYSTGVSLNTRIFGMKQFKEGSKIHAIRHVMTPSISMNYNPDFTGGTSNGRPYFYDVVIDRDGNTRQYDLFSGSIFGGPPKTSGGSVGFSLRNNIEMKVRSDDDSTGYKKIKLFESLNLNTSYNLKADSLNLSPISINGNTKILKRISLNVAAALDPYSVDPSTGRRINKFYTTQNKGLADVTRASLNLSGSLNSKQKDNVVEEVNLISNPLYPGEQLFADNYSTRYIDFSIPWDINLKYNITYNKTYRPGNRKNENINNTMTASGKLNLTDEWQVRYTTGYDFRSRTLNYSQVSIDRDLHCWQMGFQWSPVGPFQNYSFTIAPKSSMLRDLKIEKRRTVYDR